MLRVAKACEQTRWARCLKPVQESRHRIRIAKEADAADPDEVENELLSLKFRVKYFRHQPRLRRLGAVAFLAVRSLAHGAI